MPEPQGREAVSDAYRRRAEREAEQEAILAAARAYTQTPEAKERLRRATEAATALLHEAKPSAPRSTDV